jgi:hypothetical protein
VSLAAAMAVAAMMEEIGALELKKLTAVFGVIPTPPFRAPLPPPLTLSRRHQAA